VWKSVANNENTFQIVEKDIDFFSERVKKGFESSLPDEIKDSLNNLTNRKTEIKRYFIGGKFFIITTVLMAICFYFHIWFKSKNNKEVEKKDMSTSIMATDIFSISPATFPDSIASQPRIVIASKTANLAPVVNLIPSSTHAIQFSNSSNPVDLDKPK
jgi:hypothetical protein